MSRKYLCIHIMADALYALVARAGAKSVEVESHYYIPFGENELEQGTPLAGALETLAGKADLEDTQCLASYAMKNVSFRNLKIPFKEKKKIKQVLPFELEASLPGAMEDYSTDFRVLNLFENSDNADVIAAAVNKNKLESFIDEISILKLETEMVAVGGFQTALCLNSMPDLPDEMLFIDISTARADIFAFKKGEVCLARSLAVSSGFHKGMERIAREIKRILSTLPELLGFELVPELAVVSGTEADNIVDGTDLAKHLGFPIKILDLAEDTELPVRILSDSEWKPAEMNNALALALTQAAGLDGFNFSQKKSMARKNFLLYKKEIYRAAALFAVVIVFGLWNVLFDYYSTQKKIDRLDDEITSVFKTSFPGVKRIVDPLQQMKIKIKEEKERMLAPTEGGKNIRTVDILNRISSLISENIDVNFNQLVLGPGSVLISGSTGTFNMVDDIKNSLTKSDMFKKITISSANSDRTGKRINFKLKIQLS